MNDEIEIAEATYPAAAAACPGPPHEKPSDRDYPCWDCRLDAYFAYNHETGQVRE